MAEKKVVENKSEDKVVIEAVGAELKKKREAKKVSLDQVSAELNIKVAQLEAIEKGDMSKLPEMIYAAGFVRNYASFLGMDGKQTAERFKDEHSREDIKTKDFAFPEPLYENSVPGPTILGVGAFLSIVVLLAWVIYSSMGVKSSNNIDQNYASEEVAVSTEAAKGADAPASNVRTPEFVEENAPAIEAPKADDKSAAVAKDDAKVSVVKESQSGEDKLATLSSVKEVDVKAVETTKPNEEAAKALDAQPINIQKKKATVVLKAKEASWIQVTDEDQKVIFRKVLRPGDEYVVPEQKGLSLVTANAGGLEVYVRGNLVQSIGNSGEIVRGISLDPKELETRRIKSSIRR